MWWGPIFIYDIRCIHCVGSTLYMIPCPVSMARPWYPPPFVYPAPEFAGVVAVVVVIVVRSSSFTNTPTSKSFCILTSKRNNPED